MGPQRTDRYTRDGVDPELIASGLGEPGRLAALDETGLLDAPAEEAFDRFTRLASRLLGAPIAAINLITDERQVVLSEVGFGPPWSEQRQVPLSHSVCQHVVSDPVPLILTDAREHPTLRHNLGIEQFGMVAYAGVPLINSDDQVLGAFCVTESKPREWTGAEVEVLRDLAAAVVNEIDLRVTQSRLIQERTFLEAVLENLQDAVFACDRDGHPLIMNDALRSLQGVPTEISLDLAKVVEWGDLLNPEGEVVLWDERPLARALAGRRTSREAYSFVLRDSGNEHEIEVSAAPISLPDGEQIGAVSVLHDVTERNRAERAREQFFALVSHELRTPLAAIRGYLEMLTEVDGDKFSPEGRGFMEVLDRNGERLMRLVGDLLFAAQADAGTMSLVVGDVDVPRLVDDAVQSALPRAEAAGIEVVAIVEETVPTHVAGDAGRLAQVVDNLVTNALKFTPAGGRVTVRAAMDGPERLELCVADTGIGIPADEQPALFDRFARAKAAKEGGVQGVGLGLSICKAIVNGHGGWITLDSEPGSGTTFTVSLPVSAESQVVPPGFDEPTDLREARA